MSVVVAEPDGALWAGGWERVDGLGQRDWAVYAAPWHLSSHLLVSEEGGSVCGFLRYMVQAIGGEDGREPVRLGSEVLLEAKVLAFGVAPERRRQGHGRAMQQRLIADATAARLYQVRSLSGGRSSANHALKLSLGFALHPVRRGDDGGAAYFLLPLRRNQI